MYSRDVEEPFEATPDGVLNDSPTSTRSSRYSAGPLDAFGFPTILEDSEAMSTPPPTMSTPRNGPSHSSSPIPRPEMARRLTEVSRKYDRDGKGYLDETEKALRRMDSTNKGFLDIDKVYRIMENLQTEQQASAELIDAFRKEHKRSMSLRRGVIALACFTVLLAISNIGTSFAAARMAKDTKVSSTGDLTDLNGQLLGVTSKQTEFNVHTSSTTQDSATRHRHLQQMQSLVCSDAISLGYGCELQGMITFSQSVQLYKEFCPVWPNPENTCQGTGREQLLFTCNGRRSTIYGGDKIPPSGPIIDYVANDYSSFPSVEGAYQATQPVYPPSNGRLMWQSMCMLDFEVSFACFKDQSECAIFATYDTAQCNGLGPTLCGDATTTAI